MSAGRAQQPLFGAELAGVEPSEVAALPSLQVVVLAAVETPSDVDSGMQAARAAALEVARAARARWRIGDVRDADNTCPACGRERLERLEEVAPSGLQTWVLMCVTAGCARARSAIGAG